MKRSALRLTTIGLALLLLYGAAAGFDISRLSQTSSWSGFQKLRVKAHLEVVTLGTFFVPPIGRTLAVVHHSGRLLDAYIDREDAPGYTMDFMRSLIMEAVDCRKKLSSHEKSYLSGRAGHLRKVTCDVPFAFGVSDRFELWVYSERVKKEPKTSFFVHGLGITPTSRNQSPMFLLRDLPQSLKDTIEPIVSGLDGLVRELERQGIARSLWINLTETNATSSYSDAGHRMSQREWTLKVRKRNRAGEGMSAELLFAPYR